MADINDFHKQEHQKYLAMDEDELLQDLTEDELRQLNLHMDEIDPDNQLLPAGLRQKDQTDKSPTGPLDREKLLQFIEDEALKLKDVEDVVPYKPGVKRGKVYQEPEIPASILPSAQLDPELEECLNTATEAELTDIAAILGMHSIMNTDQFYSSLKETKIANKTGYSSLTKCELQSDPVMEPPNSTDVEDTLRRLKENDSTLTNVNLNNIKQCQVQHGPPTIKTLIEAGQMWLQFVTDSVKNIPIHTLKDYCESFKTNTYVTSWALANTRSNDGIANAVADMLKINRTLKVLNIESNFVTGEGIVSILRALENNNCLEELRFDNQRQQFGNKVENELAGILLQNTTLKKLGYNFTLQGPRGLVADRLTRNRDLVRKSRASGQNPSATK